MANKTINVNISPLLASCLQRMLVEEINNQRKWAREDKSVGVDNAELRDEIIKECGELQEDLKEQGIAKHIVCY